MATSRTSRRRKQQFTSPALTILGIGLLILLLVVQLIFDFRMAGRQNESTPKIATLILTAIDNSNKPAVIEPISRKTYLPDASLVLPALAGLGDVRYQYTTTDSADASMQITLASAQSASTAKILATTSGAHQERNDFEAMFAAVPAAQSCARGFDVQFGTKSGTGTLVFTKQLADGRTMTVYRENPGCLYNLQPLLDALNQAESY